MQPYPPAPVVTERCACHVLLLTCVPTMLGALALAAAGLVRAGPGAGAAKRD